MISEANVVDRLVALAARRGSISTEDLRRIVPVDAMSVEELASLIARLEDRGVTVEIDPALLTPRQRPSDPGRAAAAGSPPPEPPRPAATVRPMARPAEPSPSPARPPERQNTATPGFTSPSRLALLGLILIVILVLAWVIWS